MAVWFYNLSQEEWEHPERYRFDIWENERWKWDLDDKKVTGDPKSGDTVLFYFGGKGGEPGFYGWAVILQDRTKNLADYTFALVAPSDQLKMRPWGDTTRQENTPK